MTIVFTTEISKSQIKQKSWWASPTTSSTPIWPNSLSKATTKRRKWISKTRKRQHLPAISSLNQIRTTGIKTSQSTKWDTLWMISKFKDFNSSLHKICNKWDNNKISIRRTTSSKTNRPKIIQKFKQIWTVTRISNFKIKIWCWIVIQIFFRFNNRFRDVWWMIITKRSIKRSSMKMAGVKTQLYKKVRINKAIQHSFSSRWRKCLIRNWINILLLGHNRLIKWMNR